MVEEASHSSWEAEKEEYSIPQHTMNLSSLSFKFKNHSKNCLRNKFHPSARDIRVKNSEMEESQTGSVYVFSIRWTIHLTTLRGRVCQMLWQYNVTKNRGRGLMLWEVAKRSVCGFFSSPVIKDDFTHCHRTCKETRYFKQCNIFMVLFLIF